MTRRMTVQNKLAAGHRFFPHCGDGINIMEKRISIPVGIESFMARTMVCKKCGCYALTPEVRHAMDEWGRKFTKNIIEPQPVFTETAHQFAEKMSMQYGLKRVPFFRVLTAFYLSRIVNRDDFLELKNYYETHVSKRFLNEGARSKVSVPIRYLMYRKLQTFSEVWKIPHSKVIEEAVLFGLTVLSSEKENFKKLKTISESLHQYIADVAQAA
ncbi:MAG: hypothetical protein AABZ06_12725 [Bdellovibrionota bacterium]